MSNAARSRHLAAWAAASLLVGASGFGCAASDVDDALGGNTTGGSDVIGGSGGALSEGGAGAAGGAGGGAEATGGMDGETGGTGGAGGGEGGEGGAGPTCGDGIIEAPFEQCEGEDFGGKTCADFGLSAGTLQCNSYCTVVVSSCTPNETCNDGTDNDLDDLVDCADDDCGEALACTNPCAVAGFLSIPDFDSGDLSGAPNVLESSCAPGGGRENVFRVTAVMDGDMSMQLSGIDGVISVRTTCNDPATETHCVNASGGSGTESLSFEATAGSTYYVIVESASPTGGGFYSFQIDQPTPEDFCTDQTDDDLDGLVDCDDPESCQGISPDCTPGSLGYGEPCFDNTECSATGEDPICLGWQQGFNNGYCSEFCAGAGDCPGGGVCIDINISLHGVCFKGCATVDDCPNGLDCVDDGINPPHCNTAPELNCQDYTDNDFDGLEDCEDATACATSFSCTPGPRPAGASCQIHNQCSATANDPLCLVDPFFFGWPGGYCTEYCDLSAPDCPAGSVCSDYIFLQSGNGTCMDSCNTDADCRAGYQCLDFGEGLICVN